MDIMLAGGKPNEHLDKNNLEVHKILPEQREDLLAFFKSLSVDCKLKKPALAEVKGKRHDRYRADRRSEKSTHRITRAGVYSSG